MAVHGTEQFGAVYEYVKTLRKRGVKTVDFYIHFTNKKHFEAFQGSVKDVPIGPKDVGFFGQFKNPELSKVKEKSYDVFIDLSNGKSLVCDLLLAQSVAKWKAGRQLAGREHLLDFMIAVKEDDIRNVIHYLDQYLWNFNNLNAA